MSKSNYWCVFGLMFLAISLALGVNLLKNKLLIDGKDVKQWHDAYLQQVEVNEDLRTCVNTGTVLAPIETYGSLMEMRNRVRNNCQ